MQGKMDDIAGRVWTWLAVQDSPKNIMQIIMGIKHYRHDEVTEALRFWVSRKEMRRIKDWEAFMYEIINRKDPGDE
jgi:hypothetical protein